MGIAACGTSAACAFMGGPDRIPDDATADEVPMLAGLDARADAGPIDAAVDGSDAADVSTDVAKDGGSD